MNANMNTSPEDGMEGRLWEYIDGSGSVDERSVIEKLLADKPTTQIEDQKPKEDL